MKLLDFLKVFDGFGLEVVVYDSTDSENELWFGTFGNIPWWVADHELETDKTKLDYSEPVQYRSNMRNNKPGLVIIVHIED